MLVASDALEEGSLYFVSRHAKVRRERKNRAALVGMTEFCSHLGTSVKARVMAETLTMMSEPSIWKGKPTGLQPPASPIVGM